MSSWRRTPVAGLLAIAFATELGAQHQHAGVMYHAPRWSPDGQWILASANLDGDTEIYLVRSDGSALRQLTRNDVPNDMARWSDDGRRVVFLQSGPEGEAQFSMAIDGTDVRAEPQDSVTARRRDGKVLLFESVREGRGRLFLMDADRTGARPISSDRHAEQGSFSPDGRMLVWEERDAMHDRIDESRLVVARADGSDARPIATGTDPSWSPDGRSILFKTPDAGARTLWISTVTPSGRDLKKLAPGVHPNWSPDGQRIAYMRDRVDGGADIWIMNRDGSGGRCLTCAAPFR